MYIERTSRTHQRILLLYEMKEHHIHTNQTASVKIYWHMEICALCRIRIRNFCFSQATLSLSLQFSATPLPPFFSPLFRQCHCHNFFSLYFGNVIATIGFPLGTHLALAHFGHFTLTWAVALGSKNFGNEITEIQNFLSPTFSFFLSYFC